METTKQTFAIPCVKCKKTTPHINKPHSLNFMFNGEFRQEFHCKVCGNIPIMGEVRQNLIAKGIPYEMAGQIQKMYWKIWETESEMTSTEIGLLRFISGRSTKRYNEIDLFTGL